MQPGYDKALYLLPFDHRNSYVKGMFDFSPPLDAKQQAVVEDSKQLIYDGFLQALQGNIPKAAAGVLVDEEFGAGILRDAHQRGYVTALSVERSGSDEFQFEYGDAYAEHIESFDPTFAKVLVRYNPEDDAAMNRRQAERLAELSGYCERSGRRLMFELLVPATQVQLESVNGDKNAYDLRLRPKLMVEAIRTLQESGVEPAVWKIEGLDRRDACERVVEVARRDGRSKVACIVLGRGADDAKVRNWLETAASVPGFIGFAVGRTSFFDAVADFEAKKTTRQQAAQRIAEQYAGWASIFENARGKAA
jgi:myo-inositol catabolism protein IolC